MRKPEIDHILTRMLESNPNISDLILTVDKPFQVESAGQLVAVELRPHFEKLTPFQTEIFALNLINQDHRLMERLIKEGSCDLSYELPGVARFRVNIFSQRGQLFHRFKKTGNSIFLLAQNWDYQRLITESRREKNGIVLVTGATGSGKTTSLAAVINEINEKYSLHIITLEDPVEYTHHSKKVHDQSARIG